MLFREPLVAGEEVREGWEGLHREGVPGLLQGDLKPFHIVF